MFEIGVMFWAGGDPAITEGFHRAQLGVPGDLPLDNPARWRPPGLRIDTVFAAFHGESYADIPTVQATVGFVPHATRDAREKRMLAISDFAAALGVSSIAAHIGFVSEKPADPDYAAVRDLVRRICDYAARHGQTFALETGQETAEALRRFIADADRKNLGINFDPANMVLYGTGDPIEALEILAPHILSVHAKDGDWPAKDIPGALGREKALGEGAVGIQRFLTKLTEVGYKGPLFIEREAADPGQRLADIRSAVTLLRNISSCTI